MAAKKKKSCTRFVLISKNGKKTRFKEISTWSKRIRSAAKAGTFKESYMEVGPCSKLRSRKKR